MAAASPLPSSMFHLIGSSRATIRTCLPAALLAISSCSHHAPPSTGADPMPSTASQATPVSLPDGPTILHLGGGVIEVHVSTDGLRVSRTTLLEYVEHAARAMANYYGHFPVARMQVAIPPGGNGGAHWPISRVLEVGDRATGTAVLADLHQKMGPTPFAPDLDALWKQLGVRHDNGQISFNDAAPLAAVRKAITARDGR